MADSKFLKWQDIDRDGLIDVCDDDLRTPPTPCKGPCVPDPFSIVPDWKKMTAYEPFLNTKICHFQITKPTPYDSTADIDLINANEDGGLDEAIDLELKEKFKEFELEMINNLLDMCPIVGARLNNEETREIVRKAIEYKKYDLHAAPGSRLKLLYSVPFDVLYYLADPPVEEEPDEDETGPGWEKFTYNAEHIMTDAIRVRKGLNFYSKLLKVSVAIGEGNAYRVGQAGTPTHIFNLEDYGDSAMGFGDSVMKSFVNALKRFLANRGKALPDSGPKGDPFGPIFDEKVTKIKFSFKNKEIRVMRVYTKNCGNKPAIYTKRSGALRTLLNTPTWKDETAVHYFINMKKMATQLSARVQIPWRQFIEEHTYPPVRITYVPVQRTLDTCIGDELGKEAKQLGEDILDEIFGLGDLVAYLYNDTLCRSKLEEVLKDAKNLNQSNPDEPDTPFSREVTKILARNQKYKKLRADDDVVLKACITLLSPLSMKAGGLAKGISPDIAGAIPSVSGGGMGSKNGVWMEVLGDLKLCGLLDLLFESLGCLMGGLSLADALPIIIKSALDVMGIENFGNLFIGLPPEQQERMDALVQAKLTDRSGRPVVRQPLNTQSDPDGGFFEGAVQSNIPPGVGQGLLKAKDFMYGGGLVGAEGREALQSYRPWENEEVIAAQRTATQKNHDGVNFESETQATAEQVEAEMAGSDRTILSSLDSSRNTSQTVPVGRIMTAYMEALMEVYSDNLLELLDELNHFPGAPLLRDLMALTGLKCPRPALFTPSLDSFLKSLDLAFCRKVKEVEIPSINLAALELKIGFKDIKDGIMRVARFLVGMIILIVVNQLIAKVCEILSKAVCKALETTGDIIKGLPGAMSGQGPTITEIVRENICGENVDDETLENSIVELMATLALGPAAFADRDKTIQFANDLSSAVTRQEFADALMGNPSEEFVESVDQMLEYVHTDFRDALPNKNSIARFAKNIGNFMPLEFREVLIEYSNNAGGFDDGTPANPSICSSPEQLMKFKELRCELLGSRVSQKQCEKLFCDLRDETLTDLEDLQTIINGPTGGGIGEWVADKVPSLLSIPGCDDGLLPFETPEMINVSTGFLQSTLDSLENDYLDDMLGTGFTLFGSGDRNFGFINMVLADTNGNPLSNHHRKASNRKGYVNFAANMENGGEESNGFFSWAQGNADFSQQEGQYPYYVAEWLKRQYLNAAGVDGTFSPGFNEISAGGTDLSTYFSFNSTNTARGSKHYDIDLDDLGYSNIFGRQGISTFTAPDFGYNTIFNGVDRKPGTDIAEGLLDLAAIGSMGVLGGLASTAADAAGAPEGSTLKIERLPRKGDPSNGNALGPDVSNNRNGADIVLNFKDNAMGTRDGLDFGTNDGGNEWSYGFEVQCYYSDIELVPGTFEGELRNRPDDNIRVQIVEKVNFGCDRKYSHPMSKQIAAQTTRLPPFDFPNWVENIPIVGWAVESLINLFMLPFSALISGILNALGFVPGLDVQRMRAYEFLAVDDGLDAFKISSDADPNKEKSLDMSKFPNYANSTVGVKPYAPQIYALADLLGQSPSESLKTEYDQTMTTFYKDFAKIIGNNKSGWLYGAGFDFISEDDYEYGVVNGGEWTPYDDYTVPDGEGGTRGVEEEDMILGVSRNQHRLGKENARVIYLDPLIFGGTFARPPMHVKKLRYDGWWGMVQAFFPDGTACKPHGKNMIDFDEIKQMIDRHYPTLPEDTRIYEDIECVRQVPFDRILPRTAKMGLYTLILAAIRIYASTHIMKSVGTFSAIQPKFPDNFSSVFSAYVIERMEEDFKDAQPAFWEAFNVFKDEEFWYGFLEQAVECYDFLVNAGELPEPVGGGYLQRAADTINNLQTNYAYAYRTKDVRDYTDQNSIDRTQKVPGLWESKFTGEAGVFETLKGFRERKNFEGIKSVEDEAKLILQELVNYEFSKMGEKFVKNMQQNGFSPEIFDLDYWIFEKKCAGSSIKIVGPKTIDVSVGLPSRKNPDPFGTGATLPGPYFTPGGQFRVAKDVNEEDEFGYTDEYVGYYHVYIDDDGDEVYMTGAIHSDDAHDIIVPVADILQVATTGTTVTRYPDGNTSLVNFVETEEITVPIGDVPDYGTGDSTTEDKPFKLEKYISINGTKKSTTAAKDQIRAENPELRISDIWPGTLKLITNDDGEDVGIEGNIGVRHGLAFYYKGTLITSVEVDALDFKTSQFQPVQANSKLLHCLLQHLKHDPKYKLLMSYVFSMKKVTSTLAIYNDMGFLASVGEVTPGPKDSKRFLPSTSIPHSNPFLSWIPFFNRLANTNTRSDWMNSSPHEVVRMKPGSRVFIKTQDEVTTKAPTDRNKQIYGLPDSWDDDLVFDATTFDVYNSGLTGNEGWEHPKDRPWATPFTLNWDEWDRVLLRNSRARIKKLFRTHYYAATRKPGDRTKEKSPVHIKLRNLKARVFPTPGAGMLPWWQRRRLRQNPYNADGEMCDGPDILD